MKAKKAEKRVAVLQIGAQPAAVKEMAEVVLRILNTSAGDTVKVEAVKALAAGLSVSNTTISGCHFESK